MRSYVILVNWNGHRDTIECLESLLRLAADDFRVIVVDNASSDGSTAAITAWAADPAPDSVPGRFKGAVWDRMPAERRLAPTVRVLSRARLAGAAPADSLITLIEAGANLGFAGANNLGLAFAARDPEAAYFWVLNNDTVVDPRSLSALLAQARARPEQGIIGAVLLYYHDPDTVQALGGWCKPRRALAGHIGFGRRADDLPPIAQVEAELAYVAGASMFVSRAAYLATGGMSEEYFLYFEELDWAKRLPAGMTLGICYEALVYHKEGQSIGTSSLSRPSDTSLYYLNANTVRYYLRHERRYAGLAIGRMLYNLVGYGRRRDRAAFAVTFRALLDVATRRQRRGPWNTAEFHGSPRPTEPSSLE